MKVSDKEGQTDKQTGRETEIVTETDKDRQGLTCSQGRSIGVGKSGGNSAVSRTLVMAAYVLVFSGIQSKCKLH